MYSECTKNLITANRNDREKNARICRIARAWCAYMNELRETDFYTQDMEDVLELMDAASLGDAAALEFFYGMDSAVRENVIGWCK